MNEGTIGATVISSYFLPAHAKPDHNLDTSTS
jgi:hypothetical protein